MFFRPTLYRDPQFWHGLRELAPQAPGVAAWGLAFGHVAFIMLVGFAVLRWLGRGQDSPKLLR